MGTLLDWQRGRPSAVLQLECTERGEQCPFRASAALRKGIGLSGAAWYHRPLAILNGFETEFTFKILPNPTNKPHGKESRPRASDGFAFVLQLDRDHLVEDAKRKRRWSQALGASGLQLGFGGLTSCFAVQFATKPSCAREIPVPASKTAHGGEGDGSKFLCSLLQ